MDSVIVTVKLEGEARVRDIEVRPDINSSLLAESIANAFGWDVGDNGEKIEFVIEATPPGVILTSDQTLAQVGAWDGSWLVLKRKSRLSGARNGSSDVSTRSGRSEVGERDSRNNVISRPTNIQPPAESPLSSGTQGYAPRRIDDDN